MIRCAFFFKITIFYGKNLMGRKGGKGENVQGLQKYFNISIQDDGRTEKKYRKGCKKLRKSYQEDNDYFHA